MTGLANGEASPDRGRVGLGGAPEVRAASGVGGYGARVAVGKVDETAAAPARELRI